MIKLTKVVQTCSACPSQWDAWDEDGKYYYIRFRFNRLTVGSGHDDSLAEMENLFALGNVYPGDDLAGQMTWDEVKLITKLFEGV